jgi:radical SAM superfamily enzyme YgiQ (UPF0313 family)
MKLGLIAMSGVRAYNQELLAFGLTLPGFVERSQVIASLPSLGLLTLAGLTPPPHWDVAYREVRDLTEAPDRYNEFDLVAISSLSSQIVEAYAIADRYRAAGATVVLGGLHVSALPEEALAHADSVVVGEAEPVWPTLLADFERGALQPRYRAGGQFPLAESPMPRFDLLDPERYNRITVQTQRGCPYRCEFCASSIRIAPRYMVKPVERVIAEVRAIKEIWRHPFIEFADDNTFVNKIHSKRLMRALIPERIRWFTETDISVAEDDDLLDLMRESGCAQILIGLESPSAAQLDGLEQKTNWKAKQLDRYKRAIANIQRHGITVNGCFVLGLDGADTSSFDDVWRFVQESELYEIQITVLTAFPGTPLYDRLQREGRLLHENAWERCTLFDVNYRPDRMSVAELETGLRELGRKIYSVEFTEFRRERFRQRLREARREQRHGRGGAESSGSAVAEGVG